MKVAELFEAKSFAEKQSKGPLKWWVVTGKDGEPCGRIDARTRSEAQDKADGHWFGKGVTVKQQKPELIKGKIDEAVNQTDMNKVYDVLTATGPDVDSQSRNFRALVRKARAADVIDDPVKLKKWLTDQGMFGKKSDALRGAADKFH